MDRVKNYFNKPWNPTVMHSADPMPDFVHAHLCMVYWTLFNTTAVSLFGAYLHLIYSVGGWATTLGFFASILWLSKIEPSRELSKLTLLLIAAYCFGASVGPLINFVIDVDQSDIAKVFAGASLFFCCYSASVVYSPQRQVIYRVGEFSASILVPTWVVLSPTLPDLTMPTYFLGILILWDTAVFFHQFIREKLEMWSDVLIQVAWICFLSHHFSFDLYDLLLIYLTLWPFILHLMAHSQESIYIVMSGGERYYVSHTIAFFTDFPALTAHRHMGGVIISKIWGILKHP